VSLCGTDVGDYGYGEGDTGDTIASGLAANINDNANSPVTATANGAVTSKATGTAANSLDVETQVQWVSPSNNGVPLFSSPSFSASSSGPMSGGTNAVYSGSYAETYTPDPWGNVKESGNFSFEPTSFSTANQISSSGYTYDTAGDLTHDAVGNSYDYNTDGTMASNGSAPFDYDAFQQRVFDPNSQAEVFYFQGHPVAIVNQAGSGGTNLIWANNSLIAEAHGGYPQYGTPTGTPPNYRLLDPQGSLIAETNPSGTETGTIAYAPYGPVLSSSVSGDPYTYTGLYQDQGYNGYYAWHRNESAEQIRWLTPDPYNGSYDLMNPQSLNRYAYVDNNPLADTDPSGLSVLSDACNAARLFITNLNTNFNQSGGSVFRDSNNAKAYVLLASELKGGSCTASLETIGKFVAKYAISHALASVSGYQGGGKGFDSPAAYMAYMQAALSIACSIDYNKSACGDPELAWLVPGDAGKVIGDSFDTGFALCSAGIIGTGGAGAAACGAFAVYELANAIYQFFYSVLGWGPPQFTGSLLPRPGDLGGLGTAPIGIPNHNLQVKQLLGLPGQSPVPSPVPMM
jgi:RHS repeat-associated protein